MKTVDDDVREYAQFRGLRNTVDASAFELGDLEVAINVDIDDALRVRRRKGYSDVVADGVTSDLYSQGAVCLGVGSNTLKQIFPDWSTKTLRTGLTSGRRLSYAAIGARVFYANGVESGVVENGAHRSWGLPVPVLGAATVTGGGLRAGRYLYSMTYLRSDGQESGAPRSGVIELTETGGIELTLPVPTDTTITRKAVYLSDTDGETLFRYTVLDAATASLSILVPQAQTVALASQFLVPPPAGDFIAYGNGRMLVAVGSALYPSEPYAPEWFNLRKRYSFLDRLTMVQPMEDGTWIGTESQVIWLPNAEPEKWEHQVRADYGVIPGTAVLSTAELIGDGSNKTPAVYFATTQGLCAGLKSGSFLNFTDGRFAYPKQPRGAGVVRRHAGMAQYLVTFQGPEVAGNVAA